MEIHELRELTPAYLEQLQALMVELDPTIPVSGDMLAAVCEDPATHLFAAFDQDGRIVGCASLGVFFTPTGRKGAVEDVVVSSACRGMGLGRLLLEHVIAYASGLAPIDLHLTSRPAREAANRLYQSLGFVRRDTNVYKLCLK